MQDFELWLVFTLIVITSYIVYWDNGGERTAFQTVELLEVYVTVAVLVLEPLRLAYACCSCFSTNSSYFVLVFPLFLLLFLDHERDLCDFGFLEPSQ